MAGLCFCQGVYEGGPICLIRHPEARPDAHPLPALSALPCQPAPVLFPAVASLAPPVARTAAGASARWPRGLGLPGPVDPAGRGPAVQRRDPADPAGAPAAANAA